MTEDAPNQPQDTDATPLADLIGSPGAEAQPMQVVEADVPEKLKRKRKPKPYFPNLRLYLIVAGIAAIVTALIAGAFFLVLPARVVEMQVPVVVTTTPIPMPWPTPTAAFGDGIGKSGYDYLTLQDIRDTIPANTRVRLSMGYFDGQQWHYEIVAEGEQHHAEALESQLIFVPMIYTIELTLTASPPPLPTFTPTPTFVR